jgi:hypothetical protein
VRHWLKARMVSNMQDTASELYAEHNFVSKIVKGAPVRHRYWPEKGKSMLIC